MVPSYLPAIRYGGPIYSVHGLCRALAASGHEIHVATTNVDGPYNSNVALNEPVDLDGVFVWYFQSKVGRRLYYSPSMMSFFQEKMVGFDLVHLHSVFLWPTWAAARIARRKGIPYLLSPRGMLVSDLIKRKSRWLKTAWITLIEKKNIQYAAGLHVTSALEAQEIRKLRLDTAHIYQIPNGVEEPIQWTKEEVAEDVVGVIQQKPYVLFLGRISWKKGLDRLLEAWSKITTIPLVIAGNDEEDYLTTLMKKVDELALHNRVSFITRSVSGVDKEALFAAAGIFVLPSYSENFGNTVLEAMIRSLPVVVTEEVGAAYVVSESRAGLVVKPDALQRTLQDLFFDSERLAHYGENGKAWITKHYTWPGLAVQMIQCYKEVLQ